MLGEWLLDHRLLNKRLDIKITGTTKENLYNGRYEDSLGFLVLTSPHMTVLEAVYVKLEYTQLKIKFELRHIDPLTTTARSTSIPQKQPSYPGPIISDYGRRVIIIGPDDFGKEDYIGKYGLICRPEHTIPPDSAAVLISFEPPHISQWGYFSSASLCSSDIDPVMWEDKWLPTGFNN